MWYVVLEQGSGCGIEWDVLPLDDGLGDDCGELLDSDGDEGR